MLKALLDDAFNRAKENGDFDNLPGEGQPIPADQLKRDPFAKAYSESEAMTPFGLIQRDIDKARAQLADIGDPERRLALEREIAALETRKAIEMETFKKYS